MMQMTVKISAKYRIPGRCRFIIPGMKRERNTVLTERNDSNEKI